VISYKALNAGGIDDPTAILHARQILLLEHLLYRVLAAEKDAFGIDLHGAIPVIFAQLVNTMRSGVRALDGDASVVAHYVDAAKFLDTLGDSILDVVCLRDVGFDENSLILAI